MLVQPYLLMVDDDDGDQILIERVLDKLRYAGKFDAVSSGSKMMELLNRKEQTGEPLPGFILLDINMPGKDGKMVLRELKACENLRHIPVIMFSTSDSPDDIKDCYSLGANAYVVKPLEFDRLMVVVEQILKYWFALASLPR